MVLTEPLRDLLLAILQGLTEFLPVSSSGHLVLFSLLTGEQAIDNNYLVFLHFGTLVATSIYLWRELLLLVFPFARGQKGADSRNLWMALVWVSIPTAILGLGIERFLYPLVKTPLWVGIFLLLTGAMLFRLRYMDHGEKGTREMGIGALLLVGIAQGFAVFPGVSRSGSTMVACKLVGMETEQASRFAFLVSLPPIVGATLVDLGRVGFGEGEFRLALVWGPLVAGLVGFAALVWCIKLFVKGNLYRFWPYCLVVGACAIIWGVLAG